MPSITALWSVIIDIISYTRLKKFKEALISSPQKAIFPLQLLQQLYRDNRTSGFIVTIPLTVLGDIEGVFYTKNGKASSFSLISEETPSFFSDSNVKKCAKIKIVLKEKGNPKMIIDQENLKGLY
ncbi:hypothetical protein V6N13_103384 [Hibiscus sabdariffa]